VPKGSKVCFSARAQILSARARNFVLEHKMIVLQHELRARARSSSCSSTKCCARTQSTSCSSTKYSYSSTNSIMSEQEIFVLEHELDRGRAQISRSTTNYHELGSSPVLGLFGWISGFVGWGLGGVAGDSVAQLSGRLSTRYS